MKTRSILIALQTAMTLTASANPADLEGLMTKWLSSEKTSNAGEVLSVSTESISGTMEAQRQSILQREVGTQLEAGAEIADLRFTTLSSQVRKQLLKEIFPARKMQLAFCKAFPKQELNEREDQPLTDDQRAAAQARLDYNHCKKMLNEAMGGIFYADPQTVFVSTTLESGAKSIILYVKSLIDKSSFLRYQFQLN